MKESENEFLKIYSCALQKMKAAETAHQREVLAIADKQGVYPVLADAFFKSSEDGTFSLKQINYAEELVFGQAKRTTEFLKLYRFLAKHGLKPVVMGGMICRNLYPEPEQILSSVEVLLISEEEYPAYQKALLEYGLNEDSKFKFSGEITIELHLSPFSAEYTALNQYFADVEDHKTAEKIYGVPVYSMGTTQHLFYLICKSLIQNSFGIKAVSDVVLYSIHFIDLISWDRIIEKCHEIQAYEFAQGLYKIGEKYLIPQLFPEKLKIIWNIENADEHLLPAVLAYDNLQVQYQSKKKDTILKRVYKNSHTSSLAPFLRYLYIFISMLEFHFLNLYWKLRGAKHPTSEEQKLVKENVTFIFKSFERQKLAKGLCRNINQMYPGVSIIVADDSKEPLIIDLSNVNVIRLPFNSGLSAGLQAALDTVETEYIVRMDDDELLTLKSKVHRELKYLMKHTELDLIGFGHTTAIRLHNPQLNFKENYKFPMDDALKPLKIPHLTKIDPNHIVLGKVANIYIARTEKMREVGFDQNIKVIDHHEFFWRAAGVMASAAALDTVVFHRHNPYERTYNAYRREYANDLVYIRNKHEKMIREAKRK